MNERALKGLGLGVATGLLSGLLGVGGGFIMVPGMVYVLGLRQHQAHGTSLLVIIPVALVGSLILGSSHDVDVAVALALAAGAVAGAVFGARLTRRLSQVQLRGAFGLVALGFGLVMIGDAIAHAAHWTAAGGGLHPTGVSLAFLAILIGLVAGIASGLLGIGGGVIMVPAMVFLLGLSQHLAQGTSLAVIIPTAAAGAVTHFRIGNVRLNTALWLSIGGMAGAVAGALAAVASSDELLRVFFGGFLSFTGLRMLQMPMLRRRDPTMVSR